MGEPQTILVVDDDEAAREMLAETLRRSGYDVATADGGESALAHLKRRPFSLVITDVHMPRLTGIELVAEIRKRHPDTLVVVVTAFGNSTVTIDAIQAGAFDFLTKPFQIDKIRQVVANALEKRGRVLEREAVETVETVQSAAGRLIGASEKMVEVFKLIGRVANTESTVLILGESGTGKELVARAIHENSFRRDKPFIAINCGAIPDTLLESELFGYEKGAFTGAERPRMGILEAVNGGTCLLDEIGEMPLSMQSKLLRFLQDGEIRRVGAVKPIRVDVRVLSATHRDLEALTSSGQFREDLYYRLNVVQVLLPPLRERKEDIPALAGNFLRNYMARNRRQGLVFTSETMDALQRYSWPGNVRELENVTESSASLAPTSVIGAENLPAKVRTASVRGDAELEKLVPGAEGGGLLPLSEVERLYILKVLKAVDGNKSMAARVLDLDRKTLRLKLKLYGYESDEE